jgi:hypothetical protein
MSVHYGMKISIFERNSIDKKTNSLILYQNQSTIYNFEHIGSFMTIDVRRDTLSRIFNNQRVGFIFLKSQI